MRRLRTEIPSSDASTPSAKPRKSISRRRMRFMTLAVRIAGWEAKGLRCPDHRVSFENSVGGTHRISLLQMPNGTGKTTTLKLLRAALSGIGPDGEWTPDTI